MGSPINSGLLPIKFYCPVGLGCIIHQLLLECPGYDTKQSDVDVPVMLELWGMQNTASFLLIPVPLCPGVVAPDQTLSMGQIELTAHIC